MAKIMMITAKCGTKEKTVSFPIQDEMVQWLKDNANEITVENPNCKSLRIGLKICDYNQNF